MITLIFVVLMTLAMLACVYRSARVGEAGNTLVFVGLSFWGGAAIGQCMAALGWFQ